MLQIGSMDGIPFWYVLHDSHAMPFFLDYLSGTEKMMYLFFWLEVEEYKLLTGMTSKLVAQAHKILEKYLNKVDGSIILDLVQASYDEELTAYTNNLELGFPSLDMFTRIQEKVELTMELEEWPLFRETSSFRALGEELKQRHPMSLSQVLDNPNYYYYFERYIQHNMKDDIGNFLFYIEANDKYRWGKEAVVPNSQNPQRKKHLVNKSSDSVMSYSSDTTKRTDAGWTPTTRQTSFMDMLPVGAAASSSSTQLRNERQTLMEMRNFAYEILDKYLSRSSKFEAKRVSADSRISVAQGLEKVGNELGGSESGRLASLGGFASVGTAFNMLASLRSQLINIFNDAQNDIMKWMEEVSFPLFKDSEVYCALLAKMEEAKSTRLSAHRKLLDIVGGFCGSEDTLVFSLAPRIYGPPVKSTTDKRRSSYLWRHTTGQRQSVDFILKVGTEFVPDPSSRGESPSKFDLVEYRQGHYNFQSSVTQVIQSPHRDVLSRALRSDRHLVIDESVGCDAENLLPPDVLSYAFPMGPPVRIIDTADELAEESRTSYQKILKMRRSSDPENRSGFISVPPIPLEQPYKRTIVSKVIDGNCSQILESDKTIEQVVQSVDLQCDTDGVPVRVLNQIPMDTVYSFCVPCRQLHRPSRPSYVRFWYGACKTSYKLVKIECPGKSVESDIETSSYEEIAVTVLKTSTVGLGINLRLTSQGYVVVKDFVERNDGSLSAPAEFGLIQLNDVVLSINGISVVSRRFEEVIYQIKDTVGKLEIVIARNWEESIKVCEYCDKISCVPSFAFVPVSTVALSYMEPFFPLLREAVSQVVYSTSSEDIVKTMSELNEDPSIPLPPLPLSLPFPSLSHLPTGQIFKFLRKETIVDTIANLLMGRSLVMLSDSVSLLTYVGELFKSLLWPFIWGNFYSSSLPINACKKLAEKRKKNIARIQEDPSILLTPFFVGVCTLNLGIRRMFGGEMMAGFHNISDWITSEQDSQRSIDRFLNIRSLASLVDYGTMMLDIDADILEIPKPTAADKLFYEDEGRVIPSARHMMYRSDSRLRASSSSSHIMLSPVKFKIPSFPESLRNQIFKTWQQNRGAIGSDADVEALFSGLMNAHTCLMRTFREYCVSFPNGNDQRVIAFNLKAFLSKSPKSYKQYLNLHLRTQVFAAFLVESIYTQTNFFISKVVLQTEMGIQRNLQPTFQKEIPSSPKGRQRRGSSFGSNLEKVVERLEGESIQPSSHRVRSLSPENRRRRGGSAEKEFVNLADLVSE